ncbi:GNAT family N-acetyltransferase [Roseomonas sp. CCTCC AB2023176]|uniref:GNAT family N-acetyltransferase n=1 Tax=Roseomonas sp. CCTCC AB2023176 TaxID=3342640 RepID=UPI0035E0D6B0
MTQGVNATRPARDEDAPRVAALVNAINSLDGATPPIPMTAEIIRRDLLGPSPQAILRLGTLDDAVVGFATATPLYDATRCAPILMVLDLYVEAQARRRGIARALLAALAAEARARGAAALWWGVDEGDDEAESFYRAVGAVAEERFTGMLLEGRALDALADGAGP